MESGEGGNNQQQTVNDWSKLDSDYATYGLICGPSFSPMYWNTVKYDTNVSAKDKKSIEFDLGEVCYVCNLEGKYRCNKCKKIYYCSVTCQSVDWKRHKKSC